MLMHCFSQFRSSRSTVMSLDVKRLLINSSTTRWHILQYRIWSCHGGDYEKCRLLGCGAVASLKGIKMRPLQLRSINIQVFKTAHDDQQIEERGSEGDNKVSIVVLFFLLTLIQLLYRRTSIPWPTNILSGGRTESELWLVYVRNLRTDIEVLSPYRRSERCRNRFHFGTGIKCILLKQSVAVCRHSGNHHSGRKECHRSNWKLLKNGSGPWVRKVIRKWFKDSWHRKLFPPCRNTWP
jgi:hypothetical protein